MFRIMQQDDEEEDVKLLEGGISRHPVNFEGTNSRPPLEPMFSNRSDQLPQAPRPGHSGAAAAVAVKP